jgi:peroxiredoxin
MNRHWQPLSVLVLVLRLFLLTALLGWTVQNVRAEIAASADQTHPLPVGQMIPDVTLKTVTGADFSLKTETAGKLTVLIFYRGSWCPFCNRHLADVQNALPELAKLGYQVLAISPDDAAGLGKMTDKNHLTYTLLSDPGLAAIEAFGLAFSLDDATLAKYKQYGVKLAGQRDGKFCLPVPSVYLIGKDGRIGFVHSDPDFKKRLSAAELLQAARAQAGK